VKIFRVERFLQDVSEFSKGIHLLKSVSVVSLVGVILIARPTAVFDSASHSVPVVAVTEGQLTTTSPVEKGTQAERLIAVGYVYHFDFKFKFKSTFKDCLDWSFGHFRKL
jgi:hypothetical protein